MIEIREPKVEALIYKRLETGAFENIEEVLLQALSDAPLPAKAPAREQSRLTGADIVAAFQQSPHKEIDLEPARIAVKISDPVRF